MSIRTLSVGLLSLACLAGCAEKTTYPPALPATPTKASIPWDNTEFVPRTPPTSMSSGTAERRAIAPISVVPPEEEWSGYRPYVAPRTVCQGKGKRRRCTLVKASAVEQANTIALVKASAVHTLHGQSVLVRYPLELGGLKVYQVETSPKEFTRILLPPGERRAVKLRLDPDEWVVMYEQTDETSEPRQEVVSIRPQKAPLKSRDMLMLQSGYPIYLELLARDQPGMLSVTWTMPELPREPVVPPLDQRPPKFHSDRAYTGYSFVLEGKHALTPPWMPQVVVDDGMNTLVQFAQSLEGQRLPAVVGLDQLGKPTIVASRLYVHPAKHAQGAYWLFIQGLHPALVLKDAAGLTVRVVRQVPSQEAQHVP